MTAPRMRQRPIFGGEFGFGQYALATLPTISNGLHSVRWMVIDPRAGTVLSVADEKPTALAAARRLLRGLPTRVAANDPTWEQRALWPELAVDLPTKPRPISRRRRQIFERSEGRCTYCRARLTLEGAWHIEHSQARALGGTDDPLNLVAACAKCNLAKGARTAVEFMAATTPPDPSRA